MSQPASRETANDLLRAEYVDDDVVIQWISARYGPNIAASAFNLTEWRDRYYTARSALENGQPATELYEYAFDLDLVCALRVNAPSHEAALLMLRDKLECADSNLGAWEDGNPILSEISLRGTPRLYGTNEPDTEDEAEAPIVFEPWTNDLRDALYLAVDVFEGEETSVQEEHKLVIAALKAVLAGSESGGIANRRKVVEAHLRVAMCKDDPDEDKTFLAWVADQSCLRDDCQLKTLADEYIQLIYQSQAA